VIGLDEQHRDRLHRAHCPMCAQEDGVEPQGATSFMNALCEIMYPQQRVRLIELVGRRRNREKMEGGGGE